MGLIPVVSCLQIPRQSIDFKAVTQHHDERLTTFNDEWKGKFSESDTGGK